MQTKTAQNSLQLFKSLGIGLLFKIFYFEEILQLLFKKSMLNGSCFHFLLTKNLVVHKFGGCSCYYWFRIK